MSSGTQDEGLSIKDGKLRLVNMFLKLFATIQRYPVTIIVVASFIVQGTYLFWYGPVNSLDSQSYSRWAGYLLDYKFNYLLFIENVKFTIPAYFYSGFITIVAITKVFLAKNWVYGILSLNLIAYATTAGLITKIIKSASRDSISALIGGGLFLLNFESFQWVRYVLSDSTFMVLVVASYCFVLKYILGHEEEKRYWHAVAAIIFCLILMSYRPAATPIVFVLITIILMSIAFPQGMKSTRVNKVILVIVILGLGLAILVHAYYMQHVDRWPLGFARRYLELVSTYYSEGRVIDDRPELNLSRPTIYTDYIIIILTRICYFFVFVIDAFSTRHVVYNLVTFTPIYVLGLFYWIGAITRPEISKDKISWFVGVTCSALVVAVVVFNSLLLIDYDWRYRLPIMPFLTILAGMGFRVFTNCFTR